MLVESFSGVRGIYPTDLTSEIVKKYAYNFVLFLKNKYKKEELKIVIGRDTRKNGAIIKKEVINTFLENNVKVIDVDIQTTPATELGVRVYNADAGIIITASHNPPEFNGFKFLNSTGSLLSKEDMELLIKNTKKVEYKKNNKEGTLENKHNNLLNEYQKFIFEIVGKKNIKKIQKSNLNIILDPNGGAACEILTTIVNNLKLKTININFKIGQFNRIIEPNQESLSYLKGISKKEKADLAAGFDCDADRVEILLEDNNFTKKHGNVIDGNYVLALLVQEVLSNKEGIVVVNNATSSLIKEIAKKHNSKVIESEVGEANVIETMDKYKAVVGGEGSSAGGIFPPSRCRDGILTLFMILRLMVNKNKKLYEILDEFSDYYTLTTKLKIKNKEITLKKVKNYFKKEKIVEMEEGYKVVQKDSFLFFRISKTEPNLLRIIADSKSKKQSEDLLSLGVSIVKK